MYGSPHNTDSTKQDPDGDELAFADAIIANGYPSKLILNPTFAVLSAPFKSW